MNNKDLDYTDLYKDLEEDIDDTLELDETGNEPVNDEINDSDYSDDNDYYEEETEESYEEDDETEEESNHEEKNEEPNNKKTVVIIVLLVIVALIVFIFLIKTVLSLVDGKKTIKSSSNSNSNVVIDESNSNVESNSNDMNNNPDYEIIATFYGNGATLDKYEAMCVTEDKEKGCEISLPDIKREDSEIIGFSTNKNAKTAAVPANGKITIKDDVTYYAITKATITATFTYPKKDNKDSKQSCVIYNDGGKCKIKFPSYKTKGSFENTWSNQKNLKGTIYNAGDEIEIDKSTVFYAAYHHLDYNLNGKNENYHEDRNLNISRVVNVGNTRFEYEAGIPEAAINKHINFINKAHTITPWIFTPAKVFVLTSETYSKISYAYGLTYGAKDYNYIDIQYDPNYDAISENATIHELAHAWDSYYSYRTGTGLSEQTDIKKLYNSLTSEQRKDLSIVEWFAGTSTEYYWHYLKMDPTKESYAGFKDFMTEEQQNEYVKIYEKYANISKGGYR